MRANNFAISANERLDGKWLNMTFDEKMQNFKN